MLHLSNRVCECVLECVAVGASLYVQPPLVDDNLRANIAIKPHFQRGMQRACIDSVNATSTYITRCRQRSLLRTIDIIYTHSIIGSNAYQRKSNVQWNAEMRHKHASEPNVTATPLQFI